MQQPLVSISLVSYNQQEFIAESIESVLSQDYENIEIVIGDDASTDDTWQIIQSYQINQPNKIKAFRNSKNLGITRNCNEVLKRCTGKYVAFHAGDDIMLPGKISKQIAIMERDPNIVLSYHDVEVFDSKNGRLLHFWNHGSNSTLPIVGDAKKVAIAVIEQGTAFMESVSVMVRMDSIPTTGYDERVPVASDWLMWIEILVNAGATKKVEYLSDVLARYRRHDSNITNNSYRYVSDPFVTLAITESKHPSFVYNVHRGYARIRYTMAVNRICNNDFKTGRKFLLLSLLSGWVSWKIFYWIAASYVPILLRLRT